MWAVQLVVVAAISPALTFRPYVTCVGCETFLQVPLQDDQMLACVSVLAAG